MPPANLVAAKESGKSAWADYWNQDTLWAQSRIWKVNARLFVKNTSAFLNFSVKDQILDIGCGPGDTAELLAPLAGSFLGVDPSDNFISLARERCRKFPNASFEIIPEQGADFKRLGKFSLFLCVSVIQYYPDLQSVLRLVRSVSESALPGARMLIADIPQPRTFVQAAGDFLASLAQSVKEGYTLDYLGALCRLPFSQYRHCSKQNPVLEIPAEILKDRICKLGFKVTLISTTVSLCVHRPSLLIQF